MRRAVIVALFVVAWMIGPVIRVGDAPAPQPQPSPTMTISR
jgi:hypothetical protein